MGRAFGDRAADVFQARKLIDTGFWAPAEKLNRAAQPWQQPGGLVMTPRLDMAVRPRFELIEMRQIDRRLTTIFCSIEAHCNGNRRAGLAISGALSGKGPQPHDQRSHRVNRPSWLPYRDVHRAN